MGLKFRIEWEKPNSLKNIIFPFDVWIELKNVQNPSIFQKEGDMYNLGFCAWRIVQVKFK